MLFFSTNTGDAWVLDPEESLALCLGVDGESQPGRIVETSDSFEIDRTSRSSLVLILRLDIESE